MPVSGRVQWEGRDREDHVGITSLAGAPVKPDGDGVRDDLVIRICLSKVQIDEPLGDKGLRMCLQLDSTPEDGYVRSKFTYMEEVSLGACGASTGKSCRRAPLSSWSWGDVLWQSVRGRA